MLVTIYRKILPLSVRQIVYDFFLGQVVFFFRNFGVIVKSKITFLFYPFLPKTELNKVFSFMGRYGLTSYPYKYMLEYKSVEIKVERDSKNNLPYVVHNGKRLYFPEFYSEEKVKKDYRALLIEQDARAAHRYVRSYDELRNRTLLDVGAAEGIFSLDTIELTAGVIIFEYVDYWLKPLQATFEPWKEKVVFVKKYVGNRSENNFITIDEFLSDQLRENLFIKMDIEGAERVALEGADQTLRTAKNIQVAICTYHRKGDPEYIADLLTTRGFSYEFSDGLMYWNKRLSKAVIRAKK
jgi:hypothetical protein